MNELEHLYKLKYELTEKYHHGMSMLNSSNFNNYSFPQNRPMTDPIYERCDMIMRELKYVDEKIYHIREEEYSHLASKDRIRNEIYSSIIEEPEYILSRMNISDVERFLRKTKLNKINKKSD